MYLLDTDIMTLVHAANESVVERYRAVDPIEIAITVITRIEILQGQFSAVLKAADAAQLVRAQEMLRYVDTRLHGMTILPIDPRAAAQFDLLRENRKLNKIGRADLLIASIALAHRATLVTRNLRHFQLVPGLRLENWAG